MNPKTGSGALQWIVIGMMGSLTALLAAQFFPSIIPARAASVKL